MSRLQPNAKAGVRILVGTQFPGGATCLYPVVRELHRRHDVAVQVIGRGHGAEFFRHHEIAFTDLGGDRSTTAAMPRENMAALRLAMAPEKSAGMIPQTVVYTSLPNETHSTR